MYHLHLKRSNYVSSISHTHNHNINTNLTWGDKEISCRFRGVSPSWSGGDEENTLQFEICWRYREF